MKVTIEQIDGRPYTVIATRLSSLVESNLNAFQWCVNGVGVMFFGGRHYATALPPLPRNPKPSDAWLLHLYYAHEITLISEGHGVVYPFYSPEMSMPITHALLNGERVSVAITEEPTQ